MFRASSEMAVAIRVASVVEYPSWDASERPRWRAATISRSDAIAMVISSIAPGFIAAFDRRASVNGPTAGHSERS